MSKSKKVLDSNDAQDIKLQESITELENIERDLHAEQGVGDVGHGEGLFAHIKALIDAAKVRDYIGLTVAFRDLLTHFIGDVEPRGSEGGRGAFPWAKLIAIMKVLLNLFADADKEPA